MTRLPKLMSVAVLITVLTPCSHDLVARVESDTSWSGSFSGRTVSGSGSQGVDLADEKGGCCAVQKQTDRGRLKVSVVDDGNAWFKWSGESKETTAPFGVVTACQK